MEVIVGDANQSVDDLLGRLPRGGGMLTFCFADPYKMGDLRFQTLARLSACRIDFLVLLPTMMDANRNPRWYVRQTDPVVDDFVGPDWRPWWAAAERTGVHFGAFLADYFGKRMSALGYLYEGAHDMQEIRFDEKNVPLYHLAFFSRHPLGQKLWREARKAESGQRMLPFEE